MFFACTFLGKADDRGILHVFQGSLTPPCGAQMFFACAFLGKADDRGILHVFQGSLTPPWGVQVKKS